TAPAGFVHIDQERVQPTTRRLGIEFRPALVGWTEERRFKGRRRRSPILRGVVVRDDDAELLLTALATRANRGHSRYRELRREERRLHLEWQQQRLHTDLIRIVSTERPATSVSA